MKSKLIRVNEDLNVEIRRIATKNNMKLVEASKIVAEMIRRSRDKKIKMPEQEIIF